MTIKRLIILLVLLALSTSVHAQRFNQKKIHDSERYRSWEVSLLTQYQTGTDLDWRTRFIHRYRQLRGLGFRLWLELDGEVEPVLPVFTEQARLFGNHRAGRSRGPAQTIDYTMSKYSHQFNVTYNFMRGPITPYVQAGVGWTKLDSNIPAGRPPPAAGGIPGGATFCATTWETYKTSQFTYNLGLGCAGTSTALFPPWFL